MNSFSESDFLKAIRTRVLMVALLFLAGCVAGCAGGGQESGERSGDQTRLSGDVNLSGSSTVYPIATAVAEEFQKQHTDVSVSVSSTGTGGGFANFFCPGKTDLNNASRRIEDSERKQCEKNGVKPVEFQVAIDALTVVTNRNNPVECVTTRELSRIWGPDGADRWNQVNPKWPDARFELYGAASTSGTFDYFTEVIVGEEGAHRSDYSATEHDNTIIQGVTGNKYAMGYFGYAYYKQNKDRVKALKVDNGEGCVKPSLKNAKSGRYQPLSRPLFTYASRSQLTKEPVYEFVEFFIEQSGDSLVSQVGYVPVTDETVRKNLDRLNRVSSP